MNLFAPGDYDLYLFHEGSLFYSYRIMGAHLVENEGMSGVLFSVWAPHARKVRVAGDFNGWQPHFHPMRKVRNSGVWSVFIPKAENGQLYKYEIHTHSGEAFLKADPYAFCSEFRPGTASRIYSLKGYEWQDDKWQREKGNNPAYNRPMSIYEVHLGSWKRKETGEFYSYRELAVELSDYVAGMGYTHVELLPLAEHPYDGSWGYQATGYYSVTSRYGTPHEFMYFVDCFHQKGIGVILDWVPAHFCKDSAGLKRFDGTTLYEYEDQLKSINTEWDTLNFDLSKPEVQSFLISNAFFWMDIFHIDGLRVDAVANMLYLDYGKKEGRWSPNEYGGRENLAAVSFLKKLNEQVFKYFPGALMMAEESTQWPLVSAPTYLGGLGFNFKWNMGWMNDILRYMQNDPVNRKWHHDLLTFSFWYIFSENFILPLSHDEVVHCKKSLLDKMPGDYWQKFANLRALYGFMIAHPGKKLLFMGGEFGQFSEWRDQEGLDWNLLEYDMHRKLHFYVRELNHFYRKEKRLWELDHEDKGFQWDPDDREQSIISFMRKAKNEDDFMIIICNFTPVVRNDYRLGVPYQVKYREIFNSDLEIYGGSGQVNLHIPEASTQRWHNQPCSITVKIPPLATIILEPLGKEG
ncbi:MAG: 1,4-alpha-glucan branching protein GlgB [Dethiobacter sp.]|jgi:1,4-alpha-glucan branching enzyme|nr:MAG: 1,4-alpha-glucan branching protein GlgB [Dethiobacter sp.]